jgi:signal transduction histidine kinase
MVLGHFGQTLSDEQRKLLQEAEKSCGRLSSLVAEMAELAAAESDDPGLPTEPMPLFEMLEELAANMHEDVRKDVRLRFHGTQITAKVRANPGQLRSALASLLFSVLREHVEPAEIDVRCSTGTDLPGGRPAAYVVVGAKPGDETDGESGWAPFQEWRGGLGFRLPVARATIERAGGRLWSPENSGGRGAVRIMLPLEERPR